MMRPVANIGLICAFLAMSAGCSQPSITGSTTGGPTLPQCPANSIRQPDGICECDPNYTECPSSDGGLICSQVLLDNDNCGGCGLVCPAGESCLGGACTCNLTTCSDGDGGTICTDPAMDPLNCGLCGNPCPRAGMSCALGTCCPNSLTVAYCDGDAGIECADFTTDPNNCGGCGIVCAPDQHCAAPGGIGGVCVCEVDGGPGEPLLSIENCGGTCVDLAHDTYDCGACGNICLYGPCMPGDAGTGACGCDAPFELCASKCIDTRNDFNHCGGCAACSPPATQCINGMCQ
jgi:hypothetical protein